MDNSRLRSSDMRVRLPIRQSCDRCHKQKLRCSRPDISDGSGGAGHSCQRCLRKHLLCTYSSSLPKGRPSMYQQNPNSSATLNSSPPKTPNAKITGSMKTALSEQERVADEPGGGGDDRVKYKDCQIPWPWASELSNWDVSITEVPSSSESTFSSSWPDNTVTGSSGDDLGFFHLQEDYSPSSSPLDGTLQEQLSMLCDGDHNHEEKSLNVKSLNMISELARLSSELGQLNLTFSPLRRFNGKPPPPSRPVNPSSSIPPGSQGQERGSKHGLVDDGFFESIMCWVGQGPQQQQQQQQQQQSNLPQPSASSALTGDGGTSALLYQIFSASHQLIYILQGVQEDSGAGTALVFTSSADTSSFALSAAGGPRPAALRKATWSGPASSSSHRDTPPRTSSSFSACTTIIRHMLVSCHTTLLNLYATVLVALEQESRLDVPRDANAGLSEIRLATVIQLCDYLIERQHQVVESHLATLRSRSLTIPTDMSDLVGVLHSEPLDSDNAARQTMEILKAQVKERLVHLQRLLHR